MCNSIQCCCKEITTKESSTQVCNSNKKEQNFCEFLKSQPAPEWTKQQKSNSSPCSVNKKVAKTNLVSNPRCGSDICAFLQSQPTPEWIKKSEKTCNEPVNRCGKPPKDVSNSVYNNHTNGTADKGPGNHCDFKNKYDANHQTTVPSMDIYIKKTVHYGNNNDGSDNLQRTRQNAACENVKDDQNANDCAQKCPVKISCSCTETEKDPQDMCGSHKPSYTQKSKNNSALSGNCGKNRPKPIVAVNRPCPCGCHSD